MKSNVTKRNVPYILIALLLVVLVSFTIPPTLAKLINTVFGEDSAVVAKFNVTITAPSELGSIAEGDYYKHFFPLEGEVKTFNFSAQNNGEVAVICTLNMDNSVSYSISVAGQAKNEFRLDIGESVDFQLTISSNGLGPQFVEAPFHIDIQQEG